MRTRNPNYGRARAVTLGYVPPRRAGKLTVEDSSGTEAHPVSRILLGSGLTVIESDDETAIIEGTVEGGLTQEEADELYLTRQTGERHVTETMTAGATQTLNLSTANTFDVTLSASCTISLSNPPDSGVEGRWTIVLRQDATGSRLVTWPATVLWRDTDGTQTATAPTLATAAGANDTVSLVTLDGGATYGGSLENGSGVGATNGRWELAVIPGSPPDSLYADGDWLYIFTTGA